MRNRRFSIKHRLLFILLTLILGVFVIISLSFNLLISNYIESNATELLSQSRNLVEGDYNENLMQDKHEKINNRQNTPMGKAEMLIINKDYTLLWDNYLPPSFNINDASDFLDSLTAQDVHLGNNRIEKLQSQSTLYYFTSIADSNHTGAYIVFYINMTELNSFKENLGLILFVIMVIALGITIGITYFISSRILGPIEKLSNFAKRIGEGNYGNINDDFLDLELHQLKTSLNETSHKLKQYDSEQRAFFQNASHELRTPLQIIKTNAEGIYHNILNKDNASILIMDETDKLGELVEDIIYISRLESRSNDMNYTLNDLRETLSYTVQRHFSLIKNKNIEINFDFDTNPVMYLYEEKSMERAFMNLISNALRYAHRDITLRCKLFDKRILISIENDGPMIDQGEISKIFDRFYKGNKGNHGIGLSIVKSVIQSYNGRIEVTSSESKTVFTIIFNVE